MHRACEVRKSLDAPILGVQCADVFNDFRAPVSAVEDPCRFVVVHARYRTHRVCSERGVGSNWELAHFRKVLPLKLVLERNPFLPSLLQWNPEDLLKLVGVVTLAALVAADPLDQLLRRIRIGEPGKEPCAVEVSVCDALKVHFEATRD